MLGWNVSVYRQKSDGTKAATFETERSERLAVWQAGLCGLSWLNELVQNGKAINLGGDGYPVRYTAPAQYILSEIINGPPEARAVWEHDQCDILTEKWQGKTVVNTDLAKRCDGNEWLIVEAWDES